MNMSYKSQFWRYWLAMNASALDAAVHSCAAFFGVAGAHAAMEMVPALNLQQTAAVFAMSFGRGILNYLAAHPVAGRVGALEAADKPSETAVENIPSPAAAANLNHP